MSRNGTDIPHFDHLGFRNFGRVRARASPLRRLLVGAAFPFHVFRTVRAELALAPLRWRAGAVRREFEHRKDLLVNVGAGSFGREGWVNLDTVPGEGISCLYDCRKSLPFANGSARGIFTEHFVEHLDYTEEVPAFFTECLRVLRPGGVLRVVVPDAERYLRAYADGGWAEMDRLRDMKAGHRDHYFANSYATRMEVVNQIFRQGYEHKYAYDWETLHNALRTFGFSNVVRKEFGRSEAPELAIDRDVRRRESLYVDAVKQPPASTEPVQPA